jgi:hypothetical protein
MALAVLMVAAGLVVGTTAPAGAQATVDVAFDGEAGTLAGISTSAGASVASAAARYGANGLRIDATAASGYARWGTDAVPQGQTHASVRLWVRVNSREAGESVDIVTVGNNLQSANFDLFVSGTNDRFRWDLFRDDWDQTSWAVTFGRWYLVEAQVEFDGAVHSAAVRIDGVHQGTISSAGTDTTVRMLTLGTTVAKTHQQDYDDVELAVDDAPSGWLATTPPTVTVTSPAQGAVLASGQAVPADFECTSPLFPVSSCVGTVADGAPLDTTTVGARTFTVTATDQAGHTTTVTRSYTVVDGIRPTVTVASPVDGAVVALGSTLVADYVCADEPGGSGLPPTTGCVGSVDDGATLPTTTLGEQAVTVTATDRAGNTEVVERRYTVVPNRPDGLIRHASTPTFGGDDTYNTSASGQTRRAEVRRGGATTFYLRVQNDGLAPDRFRVRGGRSDVKFLVAWYDGRRDVTRAVQRGTHRIVGLGPGQSRVLRLVVKPTVFALRGEQRAVGLTTRPVDQPGPGDTVRAVVRRR